MLTDGMETVKDGAAFLRISVSQLYKYMENGDLPYAKIGRSRRIPRRALLAFAARHVVGGGEL
jgi:excisionase family DNA binding protein